MILFLHIIDQGIFAENFCPWTAICIYIYICIYFYIYCSVKKIDLVTALEDLYSP